VRAAVSFMAELVVLGMRMATTAMYAGRGR
jgi:hypothetical protein